MLTHHYALAIVYLVIAMLLSLHGAFAEAVCVVIASALYASMPPTGH